ncbi:large-conductance mechanosensitive channel protein MscL [Formicincola oecophyllae]|nr:large-conductance mechanosensitive channel protein MscL [Formicincola oecophyllae]
MPGWVGDFRKFIMRGNVMDMAVGMVVGAAFTAIVNSVVTNLLTPVIAVLTGGIDFSNLYVVLKGPRLPTLAAEKAAGAITLNIGLFLNALIQFLIIAFFIFWLMRIIGRIMNNQAAKPEEAPKPSTEEVLLSEIRDLLAAANPKAAEEVTAKLAEADKSPNPTAQT